MDWLTFVAQIVGALAWPTVVIVLLFFLRPHLAHLATRLQSLKLPGGAEAQFFREELEKAKVDVRAIAQSTGKVFTRDKAVDFAEVDRENREFYELSKNFPEAAVMYSFQKVEHALEDVARKLGSQVGNPRAIIEELRRQEKIDRQMYDLYTRLSNLRNTAVHGGPSHITQDEAVEYNALATAAASQIRNLITKL